MIGCDPECFLADASTGKIVSAIGLIGGSKAAPLIVNKGALQEDNVLAELNITPASTLKEWIDNLATVEAELLKRISPLGLVPKWYGSAIMEEAQLQDPRARHFGCDPDYNVYTGETSAAPNNPHPQLRTAGGHIHLSFNNVSPKTMMDAVKLCDTLFIPMEAVLGDPSDKRRNQLYGGAGTFRPKPYGIEYRGVSNFWMRNEENKVLAYKAASKVMTLLHAGDKSVKEWLNVFVPYVDAEVEEQKKAVSHFTRSL